jgi:hypothetical protein
MSLPSKERLKSSAVLSGKLGKGPGLTDDGSDETFSMVHQIRGRDTRRAVDVGVNGPAGRETRRQARHKRRKYYRMRDPRRLLSAFSNEVISRTAP